MKLLTLNTHSLQEAEQPKKLDQFVDGVCKNHPDVIALQEVNQNRTAPLLEDIPSGYVPAQKEIPLKADNYAADLAKKLEEKGEPWNWSWLPIKVGYSRYDEGLALFSRKPILEVKVIPVSVIQDYENYRTRKILAIRTEDGWFCSIHMSWWNDPDEPFLPQWQKLNAALDHETPVYLMGDFNGDAAIRNETYDRILSDGWLDTYQLADQKDFGATISGAIDGWKDQPVSEARRIDQIFTDRKISVKSSQVIFNGENEPIVSDHYGILVETH